MTLARLTRSLGRLGVASGAAGPAVLLLDTFFEVDGGQYSKFGGRHSSDADREKLNIAASLRWLVFRFSPQQLTRDPEGCITLVVQAIRDSM